LLTSNAGLGIFIVVTVDQGGQTEGSNINQLVFIFLPGVPLRMNKVGETIAMSDANTASKAKEM
jgi:hypothetical protein